MRFVDGMGNLLISAGADGSLVLIDRRLGGMAACARTGRSLSTLDMHHDGHSIAVGTIGALNKASMTLDGQSNSKLWRRGKHSLGFCDLESRNLEFLHKERMMVTQGVACSCMMRGSWG